MDAAVPGAQEQQKTENNAGVSLAGEQASSDLESFCTALEAGQLGVWVWDIPSNQVTWSTKLEGWHGLPESSFDGTFSLVSDSLQSQEKPGVLAAVHEALRTLKPCRME